MEAPECCTLLVSRWMTFSSELPEGTGGLGLIYREARSGKGYSRVNSYTSLLLGLKKLGVDIFAVLALP